MIRLNGRKITPDIFPDKTSQVWKLPGLVRRSTARVVWDFESEAELVHLAQLAMLLRSKGIESHLSIPYLPYARQDKAVSNEATFALSAFAGLINSMEWDAVATVDVHSPVAVQEIDGLTTIQPRSYIHKAIKECRPTVIAYPDQGASERGYFTGDLRTVSARKARDQGTGELSSLQFDAEEIAGERVLVIDDICDGGATFVALAEQLQGQAAEFSLYVTHGIFSKGTDVLFDAGYSRVFTMKGEVWR